MGSRLRLHATAPELKTRSAMPRVLEFYFDFMSPFAYLAQTQLGRLARAHGLTVDYAAVDLQRLKAAIGNSGPSNRDMPVKLRYLHTDLRRWARRYNVPFGIIGNHNCRALNIGTAYARERGYDALYVTRTFHQLWGVGGLAPDDEQLQGDIADAMGWNRSGFLDYLHSSAAAALYEERTARAADHGIFGVPTLRIDGQIWWGNDRLVLLEDYLTSGQ